MSVYAQVKQALQDIVAPELKSIQVEIRRHDNRIDSLKSEMTSEISSLKTVLTTEIKRLDSKIDSLDDKIDTAIQIRERLASPEQNWRLWDINPHYTLSKKPSCL